MSNYTANLNLEKPAGNDYYNIEVHNANMDKIDLQLAKIKDRQYFKQPTAPTIGAGVGEAKADDEWYNTSTNRRLYCNGTAWIDPLKYV